MNTFRRKSELSVLEATKIAYDNSPEIIHAIILIMDVRRLLNRPACMDGSILRRLRELRQSGVISYKVLNSELAIYQKLDVIKLA